MQKNRTLNELRNLVIKSFSEEAEIDSIYFFGKEVQNRSDEYSDIDMVICSNDLAKTQSKYREILNDISPIIGSYILNSKENDLSQMVMFKDFSPYQKIDLSITDSIETKKRAGFGPFICVYKDNSLTEKVNSKLEIIEQNDVKNQLDDFLFTVPRFTKCLFRKDYDMYRRWKNISDHTIVLLYEKYSGWQEKTSTKQVPVKELAELNKAISSDEKEKINRIFPSSGIVNIAESYKLCIEFLIALCKQKAEYFNVELNEDFIVHIEKFLHSETARYIETIQ